MTDDLFTRADPFLNVCGSCDIGMGACACPTGDYRPVMLDLVREVERLRTALDSRARNEARLMNALDAVNNLRAGGGMAPWFAEELQRILTEAVTW